MPQGNPKPGELYLHFKQKLYQVVTVAEHTETGEKLVVYQALYGAYRTYARPISSFVSQVDRKKYPDARQRFRFQLVERKASESPAPPDRRDASRGLMEPGAQDPLGQGTQEDAGEQGHEEPGAGASEKIGTREDAQASEKIGTREDAQVSVKMEKQAGEQGFAQAGSQEDTGAQDSLRQGTREDVRSGFRVLPRKPASLGAARQEDIERTREEKMIAFLDAETMEEKYNVLLEMEGCITDRMINNLAVALDVVVGEGPVDLRYEELKTCVRTFRRYEVVRDRR